MSRVKPRGTSRDWRLAMAAAARQSAVELPGYAKVIGVGLYSVLPMRRGPAGMRQSGTARRAFGAIALALPDNVEASAGDRFVHGMQSTVHTWPDDW